MSALVMTERPVVLVEIDGAGLLTRRLTDQIVDAMDRLEDLGPHAVALFHVQGSVNPEACVDAVNKWERALSRVEAVRATTITFVERWCSGIALEILLVSDRRLAGPDFSMRCVGIGADLWPGMGLYRLSRQIGESRTRQFFLHAADVSADRCLDLAIVDEIVSESGNGTPVTAHASRYATFEDLPVWRRLLQESTSTPFNDALGAHLAACDRALRRGTPRTAATSTCGVVVGRSTRC
jgi:isomerase DpgB